MQYVKVPDDKVLDEDVLERISDETGASIEIENGGENLKVTHEDSVDEMDISEVIEALFLGFSYQQAILLYRDPLVRLERINIKTKTRNRKEFRRQKGRIIGENGKAKRVVSELTDADIQIDANDVGIVGDTNDAMKAREAILKILDGSPHAHVYSSLEKYQKKKNTQKLL